MWGLLYCDEKGKITVIKESSHFKDRDLGHEILIMQSVIRRLAGKRKLLDFRQ